MYILLELGNGVMVKLWRDYNSIHECLKDKISGYAFNEKMREVLLAVGECKIPTPRGYSYFAWVVESSTYIRIHYATEKNLQEDGQQYKSFYVTGFSGKAINPEEVRHFIRHHIPKLFIKEIRNLANALEVLEYYP